MTTTQTVLNMVKISGINMAPQALEALVKDANLRRQQGYGKVGVRKLVKEVIERNKMMVA